MSCMSYGYIIVKDNAKWRREHIVIMEHSIGRKLNKNEIVHHINGNKTDNRIVNLQLMTKGEHITLHNFAREYKHKADDETIQNLYAEEYSGRQIASILKIGKSTVLNCIQRLGVSRNNFGIRNENGKFAERKAVI